MTQIEEQQIAHVAKTSSAVRLLVSESDQLHSELLAARTEIEKLRAEVEHMRPVYVAAEAWASAEHVRDHNCTAGDCDSCPARVAEAELYAAIKVAMGEQP